MKTVVPQLLKGRKVPADQDIEVDKSSARILKALKRAEYSHKDMAAVKPKKRTYKRKDMVAE